MRLDQFSEEGSGVRLWGPRAALEIEAPLPGVLRLRHAPVALDSSILHPKLPPKQSWAVVGARPGPLSVAQEGERLRIGGTGIRLELGLGRLQWRMQGEDGRTLVQSERVEGRVEPAYPMPRYRSELVLRAPPGEAYLGFGEKVGPLDKRGMRMQFWNTDVLPHQPDTDPLYVSIPFFIGLHEGVAWGLFLDETWRSEVDVALSDSERVTWESTGPELDVYLFTGPAPADVLRRFTQLTGRHPLPPLWSLGAQQSRWGYETADEIRQIVEGYRRRALPLDVVYLDIDHQDGYRSLTWDRSRFPEPAALMKDVGEQGVRVVTIVDPGLLRAPGNPHYDEAKAADHLVRTDRGEELVGEVWARPAVFPDFSRLEVQDWWANCHRPFLEAGVAGFWNDMNEPSNFALSSQGALRPAHMEVTSPDDAYGKTLPDYARHGQRRHLEVHNFYGMGMCRAAFEGMRRHAPERRPFVLTRAGYAGIQRFAAVWTGDNSSHWGHLELSVPMLLGLGLCGVGFAGVDIPGFLGRPSPELVVRWTQLGAFYPLCRNHSAKGAPWQEPWRHGEPTLSLCRAALERRYRLLPTLYSLMHEASETGLPPLRPLLFIEPETRDSVSAWDELLVGAALLVAPVVRPGQVRRLVYLPKGRWLEWRNLETPGEVTQGPAYVTVDSPLDSVPVWLKEGGGVALTSPALHTSSAHWKQLEWHLFPGEQLAAQLYEDAGEGEGPSRFTRLTGGIALGVLTLRRHSEGALSLERDVEVLHLYGLPASARVRGPHAVKRHGTVLQVTAPADWSELVVDL